MKNIYILATLLIIALSTYARPFNIYTAKISGSWNEPATWNWVPRNDNVQKDRVIIPAGYTVSVIDNINRMGFTDVELQISGILKLGPGFSLTLGSNSRIDILATGAIDADGESQQIYIGSVSKFTGNKNKTLTGPLYADYSTGISPIGFRAYTILSINSSPAFVPESKVNATIIYASNKNINITFNSEVRNAVTVKILTMNGAVVASQSFNRPSSKLTMNMHQLQAGIYVVYITDNANVLTAVKVSIN